MVGVSANFTEGCFFRPSLDLTERLDLMGMTLVWHEDVEDTDEECTRSGEHRGGLFTDTVTALVGLVH